jgi:hypothetical protein
MAARFAELSPSEERSTSAVQERWKKMVESYRSCSTFSCILTSRYLIDFRAARAVGSSGQEAWFTLSATEQKKFLNGKV